MTMIVPTSTMRTVPLLSYFCLVALTLQVNSADQCPESHPYAYNDGKLCCRSDRYTAAECDGGACCMDDVHVECPSGNCQNYQPPGTAEEINKDLTVTENDYNYLDLVLQWAPGVCFNIAYCKPKDKLPHQWTIHGLWPSVNYTTYPMNCAGSCTLDLSALPDDLVGKMERQWPDFYTAQGGDADEKFWKHEYCKHGTCCDDILPGPADYFQKSIKLLNTVDMDGTLRAGGITPNATQSYTFAALDKALSDTLKVSTARYWCSEGEVKQGKQGKQGKQLLYRLGVCVSKSFALTDCPGGEFKDSCDKDRAFYLLPASAAFKHLLNNTLLVLVISQVFWAR